MHNGKAMKRCAAASFLTFSAVVLLSGLAVAGCSKSQNPNGPSPGPQQVQYTAIGASDGIGFGSSAPCVPFTDCPNGAGYVQTLGRRLQAGGHTVTLLNLSVPGSVLSPAIESLQRQQGRDTSVTGNFIDRQTPFVPVNTTHVTIFAGGNDANTIGEAVRRGMAGGDIRGYIDGQIRQWGDDLDNLVGRVRSRAPNTRIVALNLPNLAGAPYVSGLSQTERSILQYIAVGLTNHVNVLAGRGVLVVDLMCDPRILQPSSFSSDGFHPSDAGYALMADLAFPALQTGSAPAPSSSCPSRTVVPTF